MFKKIILSAALIGTALVGNTNAQTTTTTNRMVESHDIPCLSRGNFMIGSRVGFSGSNAKVSTTNAAGQSSSGTQKSSQLNLSPSIGYFFTDNFVAGMGMELNRSTTSSADVAGTDKNRTLLFGPFARFYMPIASDQAFFLGGTAGFGNSSNTININNVATTVDTDIRAFGFGPGYTVIANNCFALEAQAKYIFGTNNSSTTVGGSQVSKSESTSHGFDFVVGVSYYFNRVRG